MSWPTPQEYNEALQHPKTCFSDDELRLGVAAVNNLGLPKAVSGSFASVYRLHCPKRDWAVRCFLHNMPDQAERYSRISKFILVDELDFTVDCEFFEKGILIGSQWYPLLKMQWVEGITLGEFAERCVREKDQMALQNCIRNFERMMKLMQDNGIAHGDLQHGNVLVLPNGDLRLVDYDGMFVPSMEGWKSNELGHRNYQHPARNCDHFGPYLDNFAGWVIYLSLLCIAIDPELWQLTQAGDECLLFRQSDFVAPERSRVFQLLSNHPSVDIRKGISLFADLLRSTPDCLPAIEALGPDTYGRKFPRPSVFARMIWNVKSLSFRVPEWIRGMHQEHVSDNVHIEEPNQYNMDWPSWFSVPAQSQTNQSPGTSPLPGGTPGRLLATGASQNSGAGAPYSVTASQSAASVGLPDWLRDTLPGSANIGSPTGSAVPPAMASTTQYTSFSLSNPGSLPADLVRSKQHIASAKKFLRIGQHDEAEDQLKLALGCIPQSDVVLRAQVLHRLVLLHLQHADELFLVRSIFKASLVKSSKEYQYALYYLDQIVSLKGGTEELVDTLTRADALNGLVSSYEYAGDFAQAVTACRLYVRVLKSLPKPSEKLRRGIKKLADLNQALNRKSAP